MNVITAIFSVISLIIGVSHGQCLGRLRSSYPVQNLHRDLGCSCTCDDLTTLITLVRAVEDQECYKAPAPVNDGNNNFNSELVMKLVNALINITTEALSQNKCHCPNSNPSSTSSTNNPSETSNKGGSSNSRTDEGLINLDLLNPNKKDNVLELDLAKKNLIGVGLGGGGKESSQSSNGYNKENSNGQSTNGGNTGEGLINLDLLNPNKKSNIVDVDLVKQQVLGVGLGDGGALSQGNEISSSSEGNNGSKANEGLINVDLLNPNKPSNVAEVDVVKQTVLGVGLGK